LHLTDYEEQRFVEQPVAHMTVKARRIRLRILAKRNIMPLNADIAAPYEQCVRRPLSPPVSPLGWLASGRPYFH